MNVSFRILLPAACLALSFPHATSAQTWQSLGIQNPQIQAPSPLQPSAYHMLRMDDAQMQSVLQRAGNLPETAATIALPTPEGSLRSFMVWKTPIMEETLAQRYEAIQTYTAVAVDDHRVSAKLDQTPRGFHGMVFGDNGTYFIDPASTQNEGYYLIYYKKDYQRKNLPNMVCELDNNPVAPSGEMQIDGSLPDIALKEHGGTKRTYRLALSCTGEYAVAVAGSNPTKLDVLSAMVTTMNRVNGIYEKELSVTMQLIGNNDTIVYLNGATDPFTANNNGGQLLGQNQTNTNAVIGAANYDIGHIFSTGGGGIAFLGCICADNLKARGVTGSPNPVGDPFDVDYVSHEMGHQFGANHTFNACSGTEAQQNAFEPGGGTTIMAYAGICGPINNVQMNSSDYFHITSLDEISELIVEGGWGGTGGIGCGTSSAGIEAPVMDNQNISYQIPANTPFMLTAPEATTTTDGSITYAWEQWNLGNFQQPESDAASFSSGPSFRSYEPSSSRTRVFPTMDSVINNNTDFKGERLSSVDRQLRFRAVARLVENGFGAFNFTNSFTSVTVTNTGTPFSVIFPNSSLDTLPRNDNTIITWEVAQTDIAPINTAAVAILLSTDGGHTYPITLADSVPNNGSASVVIPDIASTTARVMIKGLNNVFFDISNNDLVIAQKPVSLADLTVYKQLSVYPNPASENLWINYAAEASARLSLFSINGQLIWEGVVNRTLQLPIGAYAKGQYLLQIIDANTGGKAVKKISFR